ncbi:hypothetical protein KC338_g1489 [Hortaea werneckii]|nr:hypothetical protein KC338_g1489 [Hortaea werneckii]KAI6875200.1 hypothetical protein KC323_g396 [Hortaea werneckii]KAI7710453.1 hypothetical protein KC322_g4365 [Hortaea werneckii]
MSRPSFMTPCPVGQPQSRAIDYQAPDDTYTQELDYTRAIQQEFRNARPRRRSNFVRRGDKNAPAVTIFEDVLEDQELQVGDARPLRGKTLLGRPAQRMQSNHVKKDEECMGAQPFGMERRETRTASTSVGTAAEHSDENAQDAHQKHRGEAREGLKKDPRRRTIFVPPEDTTIMTIHPGAETTDRLNDTFQIAPLPQQRPADAQRYEAEPISKGRPRKSLAVAPKRAPLQQVANKQNIPALDVQGRESGKENVPPGRLAVAGKLEKPQNAIKPLGVSGVTEKRMLARSTLLEPTAASQARQSIHPRKAVPVPKPSRPVVRNRTTEPIRMPPAKPVQQSSPVVSQPTKQSRSSPTSESLASGAQRKRPSSRQISSRPSKLAMYPALAEDVSQPQLYEDSWLSQQEVALTELINEIFEQADPNTNTWQAPTCSLRERLVQIYHQPRVAALHKRLQASLLYGGLSRPKDMPNAPSPAHDIGLRKRYLNLWLQTYDAEALQAAAEVVVGRQIPRKTHSLPNEISAGESVLDPSKSKRALIGFLETFLVSVEDVDGRDSEEGSIEQKKWRKMILRSLMMIWLLDQAKTSGVLNGCLFKRSSSVKSSVRILHSLSSLLIPSIGDLTRVLRHFDYEVDHVQDPLDEVAYRIDNIAIDLRDGIFLTRLVELLVFSAQQKAVERDQDATITIALPDSTTLESPLFTADGSASSRLLSRHLKMPCIGKAQKVHNLQVAIGALQTHAPLLGVTIQDINAEEIVDGHREKTLSLLWSLVSNYGLSHLVDVDDLARDVRRLGRQQFAQQHEQLLQEWAVAHCRQQGLKIANLTTSFSDGRAYLAILEDFANCLPDAASSGSVGPSKPALEGRLRSLGCSNAFVKQLATTTNSIPSSTTTISNLAFLASRLLPLARRHNAASTLQQTYRQRLSRRTASQRVALMRLAHSCAEVVQTQQRITRAATVLQRAWRGVVDARIESLGEDVTSFQVLAKGWAIRRRTKQYASRRKVGSHSLRSAGAW